MFRVLVTVKLWRNSSSLGLVREQTGWREESQVDFQKEGFIHPNINKTVYIICIKVLEKEGN